MSIEQLSILNLFFESLSKIQKGTYLPIYCFYIEDLEILLGLIGEMKILGNVENLFQGANFLPESKNNSCLFHLYVTVALPIGTLSGESISFYSIPVKKFKFYLKLKRHDFKVARYWNFRLSRTLNNSPKPLNPSSKLGTLHSHL